MSKRGNGHGSLEKSKSGIYIARWMINGKRFSKSTGCTVEAEARKVLDEIMLPFQAKTEEQQVAVLEAQLQAKKNKVDVLESKQYDIKIFDLFDRLYKSVNAPSKNSSTAETYEYVSTVFHKFCKKRDILMMSEVTRDICDEFLKEVKNERGEGPYNMYLKTLKRCWKYLLEEAHLKENPWGKFKSIKLSRVTKRDLTDEELERIWKVLDEMKDEEFKAYWTLGRYTGQRSVDCQKMKWSSVNFEENYIRIIPQKTMKKGTYATIPIHKELLAVLKSLPRTSDYILTHLHAVNKRGLNFRNRKVFEKAGIPLVSEDGSQKVGFHSLRHTFISNLLNGTNSSGIPVSPSVVKSMVGHISTSMTESYVNPNLDAQRKAIKILEGEVVEGVTDDIKSEILKCKEGDETFEETVHKIVEEWLKYHKKDLIYV